MVLLIFNICFEDDKNRLKFFNQIKIDKLGKFINCYISQTYFIKYVNFLFDSKIIISKKCNFIEKKIRFKFKI